MTPTPKLRFVEREVRIQICEGIARCEYHKFLQQWWEYNSGAIPNGEWRDVPVEKEQS
jgi:hypothetical protein